MSYRQQFIILACLIHNIPYYLLKISLYSMFGRGKCMINKIFFFKRNETKQSSITSEQSIEISYPKPSSLDCLSFFLLQIIIFVLKKIQLLFTNRVGEVDFAFYKKGCQSIYLASTSRASKS